MIGSRLSCPRVRAARALSMSLLALSLLAPGAIAAGPSVGQGTADTQEGPPLTPAEQQIVALKMQVAASVAAAQLQGVAPDGSGEPQGYLATHYRAQDTNIYCGPAAVQVVSNYAWGMSATANKYSQSYISATWTKTDAHGQTLVYLERDGLNGSTKGHVPANFVYSWYQPTSGSDWYNKLVTDISTYKMPQVASVAPHDVGASLYLPSWPVASTTGHYVTLNGWYLYWDGTTNPLASYDDSYGNGGKTAGEYSTHATTMWYVINKSNANHDAPYIIW